MVLKSIISVIRSCDISGNSQIKGFKEVKLDGMYKKKEEKLDGMYRKW